MSSGDAALSVSAEVKKSRDVLLEYSIAASSGHVGAFHPNSILVDCPNDSRSRWTSSEGPGATHPAHLILRLTQPAVVRSILFGKHSSPHPCNLSDFKVYALPLPPPAETDVTQAPPEDPTPSLSAPWVRVLRNGLRNDNQAESFSLRHEDSSGTVFATRYLLVVPLQAFQPKYHFAIWHIALSGLDDPRLVKRVLVAWQQQLNDYVLRLAAKHLRTTGHLDAFRALLASAHLEPRVPTPSALDTQQQQQQQQQQEQGQERRQEQEQHLNYDNPNPLRPSSFPVRSSRPYEHPIVARLFDALVLNDDFDAAEMHLEQAAYGTWDAPSSLPPPTGTLASPPSRALFERTAACSQPRAQWTESVPDQQHPSQPTGRGGAAMVADTERGLVYLYGGWNGMSELGDLWTYTVATRTWTQISKDTDDGPGSRSCHGMSLDARSGIIYLLGRFVDADATLAELVRPRYPDQGESGPMDARRGLARTEEILDRLLSTVDRLPMASVFGESVSPSLHQMPTVSLAADMWGYSTRSGRWTCYSQDTARDGGPMLMYEHQMAVDPDAQMLFVFGGRTVNPNGPPRMGDRQRSSQWLGMWKYDLVSRTWTQLFEDGDPSTIPSRCGHAMVLEPAVGRWGLPWQGRRLWIFGGHRAERYFDDVWTFDLQSNVCTREQLLPDPEAGFPVMGLTPHATIDMTRREIHLFTAEAPNRTSREGLQRMHNALWLLDLSSRTWTRVWEAGNGSGLTRAPESASTKETPNNGGASSELPGMRSLIVERQTARPGRSIFDAFRTNTLTGQAPEEVSPEEGNEMDESDDDDVDFGLGPYEAGSQDEPVDTGDWRAHTTSGSSVAPSEAEMPPRFAQAMVYLPLTGADLGRSGQFIFFGGATNPRDRRKGDTWHLSLVHAPVGDLLRRARFLVRQRKFAELLTPEPGVDHATTTRNALAYLQSIVASVVDQNSSEETARFRDLSASLLRPASRAVPAERVGDTDVPAAETEEDTLLAESRDPGSESGLELTSHSPASLYNQRLGLFRSLLQFFPPDAVEPPDDLATAVAHMGFKAPL